MEGFRNKMKKKIILVIAITVSAFLVSLFLFIYILTRVEEKKGTVSKMAQIPLVGTELSDFPVEGDIQYIYLRYFGGGGVYFAGKTSGDKIKSYCMSNGWDFYHPEGFESTFLEKPCFPIKVSPENEIYFKYPSESSEYKIMIYYMPKEEELTGKALFFLRGS